MKASEALDGLAAKGDFYHAFVGQHSVNLRHWKSGQIQTSEYSEILNDEADYLSAVVLSANESSSTKHEISLAR